MAALQTVEVRGRAPRTGYGRDRFGQPWADVDRNGCDTRNDVLRRDLTGQLLKPGTGGCVVLRGTLNDPYTGRTISFVRGSTTSATVQIDHVVALSDAWQKGAQGWDDPKRERFANDPLNLLAVDGSTNSAKGDGDAATWLPPARSYRCTYVARQIAVKQKYGLWMTRAERDASQGTLALCPRQALPAALAQSRGDVSAAAASDVTTSAEAAHRSTSSLIRPYVNAAPTAATDPQLGTCKAAKAAGYGPYHQGADPEYDWYQDRDHDGAVCE